MDEAALLTCRYDHESGIWIRQGLPIDVQRRASLFLDRDGVIVEETNYLCRAEDIVMIDGAAQIIAEANRRCIPVIVVTNQAGIGRGYYDWDAFEEVETEIRRRLEFRGAKIDAALACPFHPEGIVPWKHERHPARKPAPGMLLRAANLLNLNLSQSWIVGDHSSDVEAGYNAGLKGALHLLTGHGLRERPVVSGWRRDGFEVRLGNSIADASALLDLLDGSVTRLS